MVLILRCHIWPRRRFECGLRIRDENISRRIVVEFPVAVAVKGGEVPDECTGEVIGGTAFNPHTGTGIADVSWTKSPDIMVAGRADRRYSVAGRECAA